MTAPEGGARPSVIMVHGAFCGGWTFERLRQPFEAEGYRVLTPDLRGHGATDASGAVAGISMGDYARDVAALCAAQSEAPILVGHSMGGLVAQLAAARTPVRALVLLAPSPPWGVSGSSIEEAVTAAGLHLMGPFWALPVSPDLTLMRTFSLDRMDTEGREGVIARMRPESGRAIWETLNWWLDPFMTTSLGYGQLKAPCLILVGERDVVHPPSTARQTASRIGADVKILPKMSHWLPGERGWERVAATAIAWLAQDALALDPVAP